MFYAQPKGFVPLYDGLPVAKGDINIALLTLVSREIGQSFTNFLLLMLKSRGYVGQKEKIRK